jgi:hypothetical protein
VDAVVWLGAHKTGSTYLQKSLDLSQAVLKDNSISYSSLDDFRARITRPLLNAGRASPAVPLDDVDDSWATKRLIFDENIAAVPNAAVREGVLYPAAPRRARKVASHLDVNVVTVVLGVRSYDTFLSSLYCEILKALPFRTWSTFLDSAVGPPGRLDTAGNRRYLSWPFLVRRLRRTFPEAEVKLYRQEELRGNEAVLLAHILAIPADQWTLLAGVERAGFSHLAVQRLHAIHRERDVSRDDVRQSVRLQPTGPEFATFYPWNEDDRVYLEAKYAKDWESLDGVDGVERIQL